METTGHVKTLLKRRGFVLQHRLEAKWEIWNRDDTRVMVYTDVQKSIQVEFVKQVGRQLKLYQLNHALVVYEKTISPPSKQKQIEFAPEFQLEFLPLNLLCCDIFTHDLQPQMQLCDKSQGQAAARNYHHKMAQFVSSDPIVVWMNWKPDSIIAICTKKCQLPLDSKGRCCEATRWRQIDSKR